MPRNCLTHALDKLHAEGGYVRLRRSKYWSSMHVMHESVEGHLSSYVPPEDLLHPAAALLGFDGEVRDTDPIELARPMTTWGIVFSAWLLAFGVLVWAAGRWWRHK